MNTQAIKNRESTHSGAAFSRFFSDGTDTEREAGNCPRRINVDPKLQISLATSFLIVFVLASAVFLAAMSFAFLVVHILVDSLQLPQGHQIASDLERIERGATLAFGAITVGFAALVVWGGLNLSRKIAGPILALRRHLERVTEGSTDADLTLRKDDYFTELQKSFNRHMDSYRKHLAAAHAGRE